MLEGSDPRCCPKPREEQGESSELPWEAHLNASGVGDAGRLLAL